MPWSCCIYCYCKTVYIPHLVLGVPTDSVRETSLALTYFSSLPTDVSIYKASARDVTRPKATPEVTQSVVGIQRIQLTPILWLLLHSSGLWTCVTKVQMKLTLYLNAFVWRTQRLPRPIRDLFTLSRKQMHYRIWNAVRTITAQHTKGALKYVEMWKPKRYKRNFNTSARTSSLVHNVTAT
jgi:hypothetical protein